MMTFISKLADLILLPSIWLIALTFLGLWLTSRSKRFGKRIAIGALATLVFIGLFPIGEALIRPLENRFPEPQRERLRDVHTAILLGGVVQPYLMEGGRPLALNGAAERVVAFDRLSLLEADLPLVISGGSGSLWSKRAEAPVIRDWLVAGGLPDTRIAIEEDSRNTWENAHNSLAMIADQLPETGLIKILIVTSAAHMPRAIGSFRQAALVHGLDNLHFVPWPVDYRSAPVTVLRVQRLGEGLASVDQAAREWVALTAYFAMGRIGSWFPAYRMAMTDLLNGAPSE